jgi:hypothetical protein
MTNAIEQDANELPDEEPFASRIVTASYLPARANVPLM